MLRFLCLLSVFMTAFLPIAAYGAVPAVEPEMPSSLTDDELAEIVDFVVGNAVFTLYHQAGHMMAVRYGDGPDDERHADRFAAITLLEPRSGAGDQTLVDAIDSYRLAAHQQDGESGLPLPAPDSHALDAARAEAIACDMIGADPVGFADVAEAIALSRDKRSACEANWRADLAAWRDSLRAIRRAGDAPGSALPVAYDPPVDKDVAEATILQDNHVLEEVAAKLGTTYDFPSPPTVRATHCGEASSRFDAVRNELVLCYELSARHGQLILRDIESRG